MVEPAGADFVMLELVRMKAAGLKQRREADADLNATLMVLAEELARFSRGVVQGACREWARTQVWWPTLTELRRECEDRAKAENRYERVRLPPPRPETHEDVNDRLVSRYGWLNEWMAAGGGYMPNAVKRATEDGPIIAVRWSPYDSWHPVAERRAA